MCSVGEPVKSLLSLTTQINMMTIQSEQIAKEAKPLFAGVDVGAEELILVIRKMKKGTTEPIYEKYVLGVLGIKKLK